MSDSVTKKYFLARHCPEIDKLDTCDLMWNMYGVVVFSIDETWVRDVYKLTRSYEEITEDVGRWGVKHFGEIRAVVKVTDEDPLEMKFKIVSERARGQVSPRDDEQFRSWQRIIRKYEGLIEEIQSRL